MSYELSIEQKPAYLHAIVTGQNTKESVMGYLAEVMRECAARDVWSLLIEERLEGPRLPTPDVFDIASRAPKEFAEMLRAIAYIDVNAEGNLMRFAENVAANRGFPLRVFAKVEDAEKWLVQKAAE